MALQFKHLFVLWIVAACLEPTAATGSISTAATGSTSTPATETTPTPATETTPTPATETTPTPATETTPTPATGSTLTPATGSTLTPATGSTLTPATGSTLTPATGSTLTPATGSTLTPATGSTLTPATGSTLTPATGSTLTPATGSTPTPATGSTPTTGGSSEPPSTSPQLPVPCSPNQCAHGSTCQPLADQTFVCLCLPGDYYSNTTKSCENAKVFPGYLSMPNLTYHHSMNDKTSKEFLNASQQIEDVLSDVFDGTPHYSESTVMQLRPSASSFHLRSEQHVNATVEIIFTTSSFITTDDIGDKIEAYIKNNCTDCLLKNANFIDETLCNLDACDQETMSCDSKDGSFNCSCKDAYAETNFSSRICTICPSGEKAVDSKCVDCPYGYSGFNCNDSWKVAVIAVGTISGALLLITVIVSLVMTRRSSKKKNKKEDESLLVTNGIVNSGAALADTFTKVGVPRIPKAVTTSSWDNRTNLEMTRSYSRQNPSSHVYEDQYDMAPYAGSKNLYAQNQRQKSSYSSGQGQMNPYNMHDNGRRF